MKQSVLKGDLVIWTIFFLLSGISLIEVFSAGSQLVYGESHFLSAFIKQAGMLVFATIVAVFVHHIPCRYFKLVGVAGYPLTVILLIWVLFKGVDINGGARWLQVPFLGFTFQPSELSKGALIAFVSLVLSSSQRKDGADQNAITTILVATYIVCGLIFTQNLSTAVMIFGVIVLMMWLGRIPGRQFYPFVVGIAIFCAAAYFTLLSLPDDSHHPFYQTKVTERFSTWHHRVADDNMDTSVPADSFVVTDENRQKVHARIAVANAGLKGLMPGNSVQRDFLPQSFSDFIFAIIAEELGIAGCIIVLLLYITLFIRAGRIASRCDSNFPAFLILGLATLLMVQALLNMMVAVGLFPVTGQTLPMVSRGGTSTIITAGYFGMMLSVSRYARSNGKKTLPNVAREVSAEVRDDFQKN